MLFLGVAFDSFTCEHEKTFDTYRQDRESECSVMVYHRQVGGKLGRGSRFHVRLNYLKS